MIERKDRVVAFRCPSSISLGQSAACAKIENVNRSWRPAAGFPETRRPMSLLA
jgi:hypothetical protein